MSAEIRNVLDRCRIATISHDALRLLDGSASASSGDDDEASSSVSMCSDVVQALRREIESARVQHQQEMSAARRRAWDPIQANGRR